MKGKRRANPTDKAKCLHAFEQKESKEQRVLHPRALVYLKEGREDISKNKAGEIDKRWFLTWFTDMNGSPIDGFELGVKGDTEGCLKKLLYWLNETEREIELLAKLP